MRLNFFADYTKRYQEIMLNLPDDISLSSINSNLSKNAFQEAWKYVSFNSYYYPDFTKYVNKQIPITTRKTELN